MLKGIDVSSYNGVIDWNKAKKSGVDFAILKVIRRDLNQDKMFESNYKGARDSNVTVQGVYNYSYATSVEKAVTDASKVVQILNGRKLFVWLDAEDVCQQGIGHKLIDITLAYKRVIEDAGLQFGVYTGYAFYKSYFRPYYNEIKDIPFWIARYPSNNRMGLIAQTNAKYKPIINNAMHGWQYSSKGIVDGISGNVDLNEWYTDLASGKCLSEDEAVKINFVPIKMGDQGERVEKLQQALLDKHFKTCVIDGKRKNLEKDGKFGKITFSILSRYESYVGVRVDGIADYDICKKLGIA